MPVGVRLTENVSGTLLQETGIAAVPAEAARMRGTRRPMAFHARTAVRCSGREKPKLSVQVLDRTRLSTQIATRSVATVWQNPQT